ncbi:protein of unknown function [Thermococcus camini]|uniref:Uncharacterized protein n=1 Tax=Thermococcus camini TaxID=2016373 RepID=A0A7G2DBW6_9EURY|nr:protein of unknown function [Thermococcus camini]
MNMVLPFYLKERTFKVLGWEFVPKYEQKFIKYGTNSLR